MLQLKSHIILPLLALAMVACGSKNGAETDSTQGENEVHTLTLTAEQFKQAEMTIGNPVQHTFQENVTCQGVLRTPPEGIAEIYSPIEGNVQAIYCRIGEHVQKGQRIATISGMELLNIQQEYAQTVALYAKAQEDYDRAKQLLAENIGAKKEFTAIEAEYRVLKTKKQALSLRLSMLHISPAEIEDGAMLPYFTITSPIDGYIAAMDAPVGKIINPQQLIVQVISTNLIELHLAVYEADIHKLKIGQKVTFSTVGNPHQQYSAQLTTIGNSIEPSARTIFCNAVIPNTQSVRFLNNSIAQANIVTGTLDALALPITAIVKEGKEAFVFELLEEKEGSYKLRKVQVTIQAADNDYVAVQGITATQRLITKGVDTLQ